MNSRLSFYCGLASRAICLSSPGVVVFAYWNPIFSDPLVIKELLGATLGLVAFLTWWIWRGSGRVHVYLPNPLARPMAYLCFWGLLTIAWPWVEPKQMAFHHWVNFAGFLLYFPPLFSFGASPRFRRTYLVILFLSIAGMLALAAFQINGISLGGLLSVAGESSRKRIGLTIGHNNGVSPILLFASFLTLGVGLGVRSLVLKIPFLLTTIACWLLILFFLLTRSTILGLGVGLLVLLGLNLVPLFRERRGGHKHLKKVLAGGLVGLLLLGIAAGSVVFRGGSIKGEYDPNLARNIADRLRTLNPEFLMVDSRARLWAIGALMMADHPLFGTGFSTAKFEYPKYQALFFEKYPDFPAGPTPKHSARLHNDYLQWGVECGAVGLTLLLWAVFVFFKTGWVWMVRANGLSPGARFQQSCFFVALFVVLMDAFFSFPAHIAPIAIFIPGLLMLWISQVESPVEEEISERKLAPNQRAIAAALIWTLLAVPVGFGRARPAGYVAQTGVFVPLLAQFVGRTHEGELEALSGDIKSEFERMRRQLSAGTLKSLADLNNFLDLIDVIEAKYEKVEEIIPFAGQGMFYAGDFEMRTHVFLTDYGREIKGTVDRLSKTSTPNEAKEIKERLVKVYKDLDEHLPRAERYYQDSLESYRWHGLYWTLGLVQWELSMRGGASSKLVDSARESLETGRRIFPNEDRFFLELDIALRVGDASEAVGLATELMRRNPGLLIDQVFPKIAERSVRRDRITGQMRLDPAMGEFFKILLPQLGSDRMDVLLYALTILDYGNSEDLAKAYATKAKENLSPLESVFIDYRVLKDRKDLEDLSEQLQIYREAIESATPPAPNTRAFFLSDLQRFAPASANLEEWEREVRNLLNTPDLPLPMALGWHMLAQESYAKGKWVETWRRMMQADSMMTWQMHNGLDGRRNGTIDATLWGVAYPLTMN